MTTPGWRCGDRHPRVTGPVVVAAFRAAVAAYGAPASTLTDNGMVFTTRFSGGRGGRNGLENELRRLGVRQKNGKPNHPQTQGKIERLWQTLQKWLAARPAQPATLAELQAQLDAFTACYNTTRPHRSLPHRATPAAAYAARPKAAPGDRAADTHDRVRADIIGKTGTLTLRHRRTPLPHRRRPDPRPNPRPDAGPRPRRPHHQRRHRRAAPRAHPGPRPQLPAHRPAPRTHARNPPQTQKPRTLT